MRDCWSASFTDRPSMIDIVRRLNALQCDDVITAEGEKFLHEKDKWQDDIDAQLRQLQVCCYLRFYICMLFCTFYALCPLVLDYVLANI